MKNKIFDKMMKYGWNLGDNTKEDFENVYKIHNKRLEKEWEKLEELVCSGKQLTLEEDLKLETLQFITDFFRAINDIDDKI